MERDASIIFSRAFLRQKRGVGGPDSGHFHIPQLSHKQPCPTLAPHVSSAQPCQPNPHLSSSRTSSTVWPVTTNTSVMSSVSILQE